MEEKLRRFTRTIAVAAAALVVLSACGDDDDDDNGGAPATSSPTEEEQGTVVVGSADFPENVLLAEMYSQVLEAKGIEVERNFRIGSREIIYDQVRSGGLTVIPEYNGNLLIFVDQSATAKTQDEVDAALREALPPELEVLDSAAAEDKDSLTVTQETAQQNNLQSMADLAPLAGEWAVGGPPEFQSRWEQTFQEVYGITFGEWVPLDVAGPLTVAALRDGDVQVANLFTTDPAIIANNFVVLEDPESVFPAQNVIPLINSEGLGQTGRDALNALSATLDTPTLAELVKRVAADLEDPEDVAKDYLESQNLL